MGEGDGIYGVLEESINCRSDDTDDTPCMCASDWMCVRAWVPSLSSISSSIWLSSSSGAMSPFFSRNRLLLVVILESSGNVSPEREFSLVPVAMVAESMECKMYL